MSNALPAPFDVRLMNLTASVLFFGCAVTLLAAVGWWGLRNPAFAIGSIVIDGKLVHNNAITLRANLANKLAGNIFTVNLAATRAVFESVPWVRNATVRREFPNRLHVTLEEHVPMAFWGDENSSTMLDTHGEVFEANTGEVDSLDLPRLTGPAGDSEEVLTMQRALAPVFQRIDATLDQLVLTDRGTWRATLDSGAVLELGGGSLTDVLARTARFTRTIKQVLETYKRQPDALESVDLRHADGYAVRIRGVTTVTAEAAAAIAKRESRAAQSRPSAAAQERGKKASGHKPAKAANTAARKS
jgi:cell division protein FtsQ